MSNMRENLLTVVICTLGLFFDYLALSITLSPLVVGTMYYVWLLIQFVIGLYLLGMLSVTLKVIWEEWRWQPAQLR